MRQARISSHGDTGTQRHSMNPLSHDGPIARLLMPSKSQDFARKGRAAQKDGNMARAAIFFSQAADSEQNWKKSVRLYQVAGNLALQHARTDDVANSAGYKTFMGLAVWNISNAAVVLKEKRPADAAKLSELARTLYYEFSGPLKASGISIEKIQGRGSPSGRNAGSLAAEQEEMDEFSHGVLSGNHFIHALEKEPDRAIVAGKPWASGAAGEYGLAEKYASLLLGKAMQLGTAGAGGLEAYIFFNLKAAEILAYAAERVQSVEPEKAAMLNSWAGDLYSEAGSGHNATWRYVLAANSSKDPELQARIMPLIPEPTALSGSSSALSRCMRSARYFMRIGEFIYAGEKFRSALSMMNEHGIGAPELRGEAIVALGRLGSKRI